MGRVELHQVLLPLVRAHADSRESHSNRLSAHMCPLERARETVGNNLWVQVIGVRNNDNIVLRNETGELEVYRIRQ